MKAFVVPAGELSADELDLSAVVDFVATELAAFKVPRFWEVCDMLPKTPSERIAKHRLPRTPTGYDRSTVSG